MIESKDPQGTIIKLCHTIKADIVAVGTQGRSTLERLFMGSVSTHVLHNAPCTIVVVREPQHQPMFKHQMTTEPSQSDDSKQKPKPSQPPGPEQEPSKSGSTEHA
eukprot:jgi/Hompol1/6341/HPOL_000880-RA